MSYALLSPGANYGLVIAGGDIGGSKTFGSVENFPRNNLCNIPDLPEPGRQSHTLSILKPEGGSTLLVCGGKGQMGSGQPAVNADTCLSWQKGESNWSTYATLDPPRVGHSAVSFGDRLLLVEGKESPKTGVELPSGREFSLNFAVEEACLIPQTDSFIVTGGIVGGQTYVEKYSSTGEFIEDLPSLKIGRRVHACGTFEDGDGRAVLLITGGYGPYGQPNPNGLSSTELLRSDSDGKWTSWATGEQQSK